MSKDPSPAQLLQTARERLEILDAVALAARDPMRVLGIIVGCADAESARRALQDELGLTELQALALLDLQFRRATSQSRAAILANREEMAAELRRLEAPGT